MDNLKGHTVVISQSMYFPWVGLLEQVRLADTFVHYDDVQFTRGFYNRVQIKTLNGVRWLTIPVRDRQRDSKINECLIDNRHGWRIEHRNQLLQAYRKAPCVEEMIALVDTIFSEPFETLADISRQSVLALCNYFGLENDTRFIRSESMGVVGASSHRLHDLVTALDGKIYLTGHGARNYLDHDLFERSGIEVRYMDYQRNPYPQLHGEFTPYVSALDLIANRGRAGAEVIRSGSINWKDFINGPD